MAVAEAGEAVFVPAVRARPSRIVRKVIPGVAVGAVILADGAPCALGEIRAPALPVRRAPSRLVEATAFGRRARIKRPIIVRHAEYLSVSGRSTPRPDYSGGTGRRNS